MEPILLLEGDPLVDCDGVAHSLYTLEFPKSKVSIKESFCFKTCKKTFTFLKLENVKRNKKCYDTLKEIMIQEIPHGLQNYGTGSMTWESSIIMSLYFSVYPEKLHGKILELGSGCGLGLLTWNIANTLDCNTTSFTFTDYSTPVLLQCQRNIEHNLNRLQSEVNVLHLDWYNYQDDEQNLKKLRYDTMIASDVAYRNQDLTALKATIEQFLNYGSCAHIFGPIHRSTFQNLVEKMKRDDHLDVETEVLKASRRRLLAADQSMDPIPEPDSTVILFVHIAIRRRDADMDTSIANLMDID